MDNTIFPTLKEDKKDNKNKKYFLEFRQLKEYYNFHMKFQTYMGDKEKIGKLFQNDYYLIDKIWLNKWKECVGYNDIIKLNLNRDINENDYDLFIKFLPKNIKDIRLFPLDNSNIYLNNEDVNPLSDFIIINKACHDVFKESRKNMNYDKRERSRPLKFLKNRIILTINENTRIIYFKDENNVNKEIIIIFLKNDYKNTILQEIEKTDNFKYWLKDKSFDLDVLDELEIEGFGYKIINKKLKLKNKNNVNRVNIGTVVSNTTLIGFKYNLPDNLKKQMESQKYEIYAKTTGSKALFNMGKKNSNSENFKNNEMNPIFNPNNQNNNNQVKSFQNNNMNINNNANFNNNGNNVGNMNNNNDNNQIYIKMDNNQRNNQNQNFNQANQPQMNNIGQINNNIMNCNSNNNINQKNQNMMNMMMYGQHMVNMQNMMNIQNMMMFRQNMMPNMMNMPNMNMNMGSMPNMMNMNMMNMGFPNNNLNNQSMQNMQNFGQNFPNMQNNPNNQNFQNPQMNNNSSPLLNQNLNINNDKKEVLTKVENSNNPFVKGIVYPHPAGLMNVGQSCYMNATIECLSNVEELSSKLLQKYGIFDVETQPLCLSFSSLLYELFHTKEKYIAPKLFKEIIGKLNPLFEGNHAADAKDLIFFIIETLHKELLKPNPNKNNNEVDFLQQEINSQNEIIMLKDFLKEYEANRTFVSDIFYGINRSVMKCFGCGICKYSFQTFNLLIFPLKKVKDYKKRQVGSVNNLDLNLYDAFLCEQEEEKLEGENMIYCNRCKKLSPGSHQQQIYGTPEVLIIILNRGRNNQDFNEEFRFDEYLDFTNQNIIFNQSSYKKYYLCGIITHLGESGSSGHFIAYCRNDPNSNFQCYNDAAVSQVSVFDAMATKISSRDIEKKTPYILLYHYK